MIKLLIVEDQTMLRDALCMNLNTFEDFEVIGGISNSDIALHTCQKLKPDLVLMDICTENNSSGLDATKEIKEALPHIKIIIMTAMPEITFVERARLAKADSFIYKNIDLSSLVNCIRNTMAGYSIYPTNTIPKLPNDAQLTQKELDILRLICEAKSRKEIAKELYLSEGTIKAYISTILQKNGYDSISKLAIFALANGYINSKI